MQILALQIMAYNNAAIKRHSPHWITRGSYPLLYSDFSAVKQEGKSKRHNERSLM